MRAKELRDFPWVKLEDWSALVDGRGKGKYIEEADVKSVIWKWSSKVNKDFELYKVVMSIGDKLPGANTIQGVTLDFIISKNKTFMRLTERLFSKKFSYEINDPQIRKLQSLLRVPDLTGKISTSVSYSSNESWETAKDWSILSVVGVEKEGKNWITEQDIDLCVLWFCEEFARKEKMSYHKARVKLYLENRSFFLMKRQIFQKSVCQPIDAPYINELKELFFVPSRLNDEIEEILFLDENADERELEDLVEKFAETERLIKSQIQKIERKRL